ncbi:MAG: type II toxin-antitoxin system death-on-curing family toxin [Phenylobacterium sp.]|nr:type II toxin-antitoxin system death-on-curing family toxin [Phenylobacterium sp.]MDZ4319798.1 type II toxin-antitoxin system death-on-curing family toxin [Phenylobacterium sp.]
MEPFWLDLDLILALYDDVLAASGGVKGMRDEGLLVSALNRPVDRFHYDGCRSLIELAATYAIAISGNHPFIDGNKRIAFVAMGQFLEDNGLRLGADDDDATAMMFAVASGAADLETLVSWLERVVVTA